MSAQDTVFSQKSERIFDQNRGPLLMGILNITPDSFHDGGKYLTENDWLLRAGEMISEGADIIDIGACSTRPGSSGIDAAEERRRIQAAVSSVRLAYPAVIISVDTYRAAVAEAGIRAGADMINDISGGTMDPLMFRTVAALNVPYVLMHIQGRPENMQDQPEYEDVTKEVNHFFAEKIAHLNQFGHKKLILDPGFGFGKTVEHNFSLLKNLPVFLKHGYPVLAGLSRKSMINKLLNISSKDALNGTSILNTVALQKGASILRVHDVKEAAEVLKITSYLESVR